MFNIQFAEFTKNLNHIHKLAPQNWRNQIRSSLMSFFDQIQQKLEQVRNNQLGHLRSILNSMNIQQLERDVNQLEKSRELLEQHHRFMNEEFEKSHFSSIAGRFKQYRVLIQSMETLKG